LLLLQALYVSVAAVLNSVDAVKVAAIPPRGVLLILLILLELLLLLLLIVAIWRD